ncbi:MAG: hypothetical protein MUE72_04315 [Chitinophagaceae bacterium]|jgi:hypothetical protein|nr:hypothetical protein [Chitinophagaceae bacterium]
MKKVNAIFKALLLITIVSIGFSSCEKSTDDAGGSSSIPANGWRIGTTNYTTVFSMRNAGQPNSIAVFDAIPGSNNSSNVAVLFNNITGIAAGTFKVVFKPNQSDLLANEIMIGASTGYNPTLSKPDKEYTTVPTVTVDATVTITGGKAKIVIPQINIVAIPATPSSTTTTFAGTIVEQ